ncbi:MAG: OmpH family outer membrane protein [Aureispira sp.]
MKQVLAFILILGVGISLLTIVYLQIPKTAYVDAVLLFEAFEGKKEMGQRLDQIARKQQQQLDSMQLEMKALEQAAEHSEVAKVRWIKLQQYYGALQQEHQAEYYQKSQEYTTAIWKQINQYTQEYGQEQGYDYILGTAGQHTLLYGKEENNITAVVVDYINKKYAGN